jgi:hypothetical protein
MLILCLQAKVAARADSLKFQGWYSDARPDSPDSMSALCLTHAFEFSANVGHATRDHHATGTGRTYAGFELAQNP